jgi:iron(III) transport system permease protein
VSYYLVRNTGKLRTFLDFAVQLPFGVPSIVLGIGMITLYNRPVLDFFYGSSALVILAMVTAYSPFVVKVVSAQIMRIDRDLEDAGRMGAGRVRVFSRVLWPLMLPGVIAGFVVGFVLSLSNLGTSLLLVAPGKTTLPMVIYNFMHYGADETVCALSLFLLGLIAVPLIFGSLCHGIMPDKYKLR